MELYADHHPKTSIKGFGYANAEKARETLRKLDWKNRSRKKKKKKKNISSKKLNLADKDEDEIARKVKQNPNYVIQVVITMYHRAKYHPHRTPDMEKAMDIFQDFLNKYKKNQLKKVRNKKKKS